MLLDELEGLGVDDRRHHVGERLAHDAAHLGLLPTFGEGEHRLAHAGQPGLVGAQIEVHQLAPEAAHQQTTRDETVPVEGTPEGDHRCPRNDGLVEVEKGSLHRN